MVRKQNKIKKGGAQSIFSSSIVTLIKNPSLLENNKEFPVFTYEGGSGFEAVKFILKPGEMIRGDGGAMNYMSGNMELETTTGNLISGVFRAFSGSSIFYNIFKNIGDSNGFINLSGCDPGNVGCFYIPQGKEFCLVDDSYICSTLNLDISTKVRFGGFLLGYGLTFVKVSSTNGPGLIWSASLGNVIEIRLTRGNSIDIDNGVLLGFDANININTKSVGGFKSLLFSGEGLVSRITNNDSNDISIFVQSRSKSAYIGHLSKLVNKEH